MASKSLFPFFIIFSSFLHLGFCDTMQCMQKLLPCQKFLNTPTNPPSTCCLPLKEMVADNTQCLCNIFNDPQVLKSLNITQDDALKIPKACGIDVHVSKCNKEASLPTSPAAGITDNTTDSNGSTKKMTPYGITHFGVSGFVALMISLVFSA